MQVNEVVASKQGGGYRIEGVESNDGFFRNVMVFCLAVKKNHH